VRPCIIASHTITPFTFEAAARMFSGVLAARTVLLLNETP